MNEKDKARLKKEVASLLRETEDREDSKAYALDIAKDIGERVSEQDVIDEINNQWDEKERNG